MVTGVGSVPAGSPTTMATNPSPVNMSVVGSADVQKRTEHRRSNKPIMEKRRRARINNCLNELKSLILDAMKKDPARHSKLEKADILEMTVKHLESLRQRPEGADRFHAGFRECTAEVSRFPGIQPALKHRLIQHLESCVTPATPPPEEEGGIFISAAPGSGVRLVPPPEPEEGGIFISAGPGSGVRLVPTRLANGDIALVLPTQMSIANTTAPARTSSQLSASASSSSSSGVVAGGSRCYSPVSGGWSPSPPPSSPPPAPLSLVTRREEYEVDETPWRPW